MIARKIIQEKIKSKKWAKENGQISDLGVVSIDSLQLRPYYEVRSTATVDCTG